VRSPVRATWQPVHRVETGSAHLVERFGVAAGPAEDGGAFGARDALMIGYANAPVTTIDLHPGRIGLPRLGHMGYFRPDARPLWDDVLDWLDTSPGGESGHEE
jgi:hypothetical protein